MSSSSGRAELVGAIRGGTATVRLRVTTPPAEFPRTVVDTGFAGALRVPEGTFSLWGLRDEIWGQVLLPDGSHRDCRLAQVTLEWLAGPTDVVAIEFGPEALVGMELLNGHAVLLQHDIVTIQPLPMSGSGA